MLHSGFFNVAKMNYSYNSILETSDNCSIALGYLVFC